MGSVINSTYTAAETRPELQGKPLGSRVVLDMISAVEDPKSHCLFFDNFFTSRPLLSELRSKGMRATGTVRENRMEKCPLKTHKELVKEGRGAYDARFDRESDVLAVRWFDNKSVNMLTNYDSVHPLRKTQRFNKCAGGKGDVPEPRLFNTSNVGMGGVTVARCFSLNTLQNFTKNLQKPLLFHYPDGEHPKVLDNSIALCGSLPLANKLHERSLSPSQ